MINKIIKLPLAAVVVAATMLGATPVANADSFTIGAMREGSAWYVFGATLGQLLEPSLPQAPSRN